MENNDLYPPVPENSVNQVQPGIEISPEVNPVITASNKGKYIKAVVLPILAIAVLGGVGIFGYTQGYSVKGLNVLTPSKVWDKFYLGDSAKIYNATFTSEYHDPESFEDPENELGVVLKNIKVVLEGSNYVNVSEISKPEFDGSLKFSVASGNTSFSSGIEYRALNNTVFYKIGDIPFLSGILGPDNKNVEWVKINLDDAKEQSTTESDFLQNIADPAFEEKIRTIWADNRAIKVNKYVGREKINGVSTLHFKAELDKASTKKAVIDTISALADINKSGNFTENDQSLFETAIEKLITKIEIKELDVWIGATDNNLYKLHLVSNAPSVVSLVKLITTEVESFDENQSHTQQKKQIEDFINKLNFSGTFKFDATYSDYGKVKALSEPQGAFDLLGELESTSADAKRLADVRQTASALELYYNDNNSYPGSLSVLAPTYLGTLPTPPAPSGNCSAQQNNYNYALYNQNEYSLTFCLGKITGGISAGPHRLTQAGIE